MRNEADRLGHEEKAGHGIEGFVWGNFQEMNNKECEKELWIAKDIIGKQAYELSVLRRGLERLRHDNDWRGVEAVNSFIDKLLAVQSE